MEIMKGEERGVGSTLEKRKPGTYYSIFDERRRRVRTLRGFGSAGSSMGKY